ncbi:hypothetical protein CBA19CS91_01695 [Paraburkholderia hospita]|nr:hypothetical protein CBA19CS91_01695 [Paraburkholderia hospita]
MNSTGNQNEQLTKRLKQFEETAKELREIANAYRAGVKGINQLILETLEPLQVKADEAKAIGQEPQYTSGERDLIEFITKLVDVLRATVDNVEKSQNEGS